jgi:hypothetical protein
MHTARGGLAARCVHAAVESFAYFSASRAAHESSPA